MQIRQRRPHAGERQAASSAPPRHGPGGKPRLDEGRYAVRDRRAPGVPRTQVYRVTRTDSGIDVRAEFGRKARLVARWTAESGLVAVGDSGPGHLPLVAALVATPHAARVLFARMRGRCGRCNRRLTNQGSVTAGFGPECRQLLARAA